MAMIRHSVVVVLLALICSCTDQSNTEDPDVSVSILNQDASVGDVYIIEVDTPDVEVDPCDGVDIATHPSWCQCQPQCCNSQLWFCPPNFGDPTVYSKQVIVDVCGEDLTPCIYGQDDDCPPPEIIHDGECAAAHECPPTAQNLICQW